MSGSAEDFRCQEGNFTNHEGGAGVVVGLLKGCPGWWCNSDGRVEPVGGVAASHVVPRRSEK